VRRFIDIRRHGLEGQTQALQQLLAIHRAGAQDEAGGWSGEVGMRHGRWQEGMGLRGNRGICPKMGSEAFHQAASGYFL